MPLARGLALALLLLTAPAAAETLRAVPSQVQVEPLGDSTWVLRAGTANVVAALTGEGWVLVDTGTKAEAVALRDELRRLSPLPVVAVFNTHFHDDHAGGNVLWRGMKVPVYASRATVRLEQAIRARTAEGAPREAARLDSAAAAVPAGDDRDRVASFYEFLARWWREAGTLAAANPDFVVPADHPFDGRMRMVVGGLVVEARTFARGAHTGGDAVVAFPARRVVAVGDVAVHKGAPWADQFMGGGSLEGVLTAQDSLLAWLDAGFGFAPGESWSVVPGHGAVVGRDELAADHAALRELRACARQAFDAGRRREVGALDCDGVGFARGGGAYAVWLFDAEWRTGAKPSKPAKRTSRRGRLTKA